MDEKVLLEIVAGLGTVLLALVGWGISKATKHFSLLRNTEIPRLIYDVIKGQVRRTMPAVITGKLSKTAAKNMVIKDAIAILGPLGKELEKLAPNIQEAILNAVVKRVKSEGVAATKETKKAVR